MTHTSSFDIKTADDFFRTVVIPQYEDFVDDELSVRHALLTTIVAYHMSSGCTEINSMSAISIRLIHKTRHSLMCLNWPETSPMERNTSCQRREREFRRGLIMVTTMVIHVHRLLLNFLMVAKSRLVGF